MLETIMLSVALCGPASPYIQPVHGCGDCVARLDQGCLAVGGMNNPYGGVSMCRAETIYLKAFYGGAMVVCGCVCWDGETPDESTQITNRCNVNSVTGRVTNRLAIQFSTEGRTP